MAGRVFIKDGLSFEDMATKLSAHGYPVGRGDLTDSATEGPLMKALRTQRSGRRIVSDQHGIEAEGERLAADHEAMLADREGAAPQEDLDAQVESESLSESPSRAVEVVNFGVQALGRTAFDALEGKVYDDNPKAADDEYLDLLESAIKQEIANGKASADTAGARSDGQSAGEGSRPALELTPETPADLKARNAADAAAEKARVAEDKKAAEKKRADALVDSFDLRHVETSKAAQSATDEGQTGFNFDQPTAGKPVKAPEGYQSVEHYNADGKPTTSYARFVAGDRVRAADHVRGMGTVEGLIGAGPIIRSMSVKWDNGTTSREGEKDLEAASSISFSLSNGATKRAGPPLTAPFLQTRIDATPLARVLKSRHGITVRVIQGEVQQPAAAQAELARVREDNPGAMPKAAWIPGAGENGKGEVLLIADNLASLPEALQKLVEEAVGHFGMSSMFGEKFDSFLDSVVKDHNQEVAAWAATYEFDMLDPVQRRRAAEEFLAHSVRLQTTPAGLLARLYEAVRAAIRGILRDAGVRLRLSDADLRQIIGGARRYVQEGGAAGAGRIKARFGGETGDRASGARLAAVGVKFIDDNENAIVWTQGDNARISVDKPGAAGKVVLWVKQTVKGRDYWRKAGALNLTEKRKNIGGQIGYYLSVSEIAIDKEYRGHGYATAMYRAALDQADPKIKGILSYTPNRVNKTQVPAIYRALGAFVTEDGDYQVIPRPAPSPPTGAFNPADYRPAVVAWARDRFGDMRAPDGSLAWENFVAWFSDSKVVNPDGTPRVVYHGTSSRFNKINLKKGSQNLFWFTSDKAKIEAGEVGAAGKGVVMELYARVENPAGWKQYDKLGLYEYQSRGIDGAILSEEDGEFDGFVINEPSQVKSATKNDGTFGPSPDIRFSLSTEIVNQRLAAGGAVAAGFAKALGINKHVPTLQERWDNLTKDWKRQIVKGVFDSFVAFKDQFPHAYMLLRQASSSSQTMTAMMHYGLPSMNAEGALDVTHDSVKGGFLNALADLGGEHVLALSWIAANRSDRIIKRSVAAAAQAARLKTQIAGLRAQRKDEIVYAAQGPARLARVAALDKQIVALAVDRAAAVKRAQVTERNLTRDQIDYGMTLNQGKMADGRDRATVYENFRLRFNEYNKAVLDIGEAAGDIDPESRKLWEREFYVNYSRDLGDGKSFNPNIGGGMLHGSPIHRHTGGVDPTKDLLDNTLDNWEALLSSAARTRAASQGLQELAAPGVGIAVRIAPRIATRMGDKEKQTLAKVRIGGKEAYFQVADGAYLDALRMLEPASLTGPLAKAMRSFKRVLTIGVTMAPAFKFYRNPVRDAVTAMASADLAYNPGANLKAGWKAQRDPATRAHLMAGGGMFHLGTSWEGTRSDQTRAELERMNRDPNTLNTPEKMWGKLTEWWRAYEDLGDIVENVQRAALYEKLRGEGKSHLEASYQARDVMDFGLTGAWPAVRALTSMVPFMNARLQGLYKLGRAGHADPKRMGLVLGATTLAGLALALAYKDDPDWKRREDWDKESYYWWKVGDMAFRMPRAFELGAVGTLVENALAYSPWGPWSDDEMTGRRFTQRLKEVVWNQLSMDPTPQIAKPLIDVYANKDSFTGNPIETLAMQRLLPQDRYTEKSSEISRGLSRGLNAVSSTVGAQSLSPVQIDSLVAGYLGWAGTMVALAVDQMARPVLGRPARPATPLRFWGGIAEDLKSDPAQSRYLTQFYEQGHQLQEAYASWQTAGKLHDTERQQDILEKFGPNLPAAARRAARQQHGLSALTAQRRAVMQGPGTSAEKARALFRINAQMDAIAQAIGPLR